MKGPLLVSGLLGLATVGWLCTGVERYDPTTVVLPDGYRGPLVVLFDQPESVAGPARREDGRRLLRADSSGVVRTAFPPTFGWVDEMYVVERRGGRCLLPPRHVDWADRYPPCGDSVSVWVKGTGSLGTGDDAVALAHAFVGTTAEAESLRVGALAYEPFALARRALGLPSPPPGVRGL